jgi:xanthine/CO dehydrogenase XdhC/CoxF family maturation factor
VRYEGGREEDDEESPRGAGCDGTVDILLERVSADPDADPLAFIARCLQAERRGALVTVFASSNPRAPVGARLGLDESGARFSSLTSEAENAALSWAAQGALGETQPQARTVHGDGFEALLELIQPPPRLFVIGSGADALPLVELARAVGFGVTVCEPNARPTVRERFGRIADLHLDNLDALLPRVDACRTALGVVMSHHYPTDARALALLLQSRALYIGVLGPERRTRRMLSELYPSARVESLLGSRLRAPIGLDLGAETPAQIALAIVAEAQAVLTRGSALPLSRRGERPIHAPTPELTLSSAPGLARTGTA